MTVRMSASIGSGDASNKGGATIGNATDDEPIPARQLVALLARTWPHLRPQRMHIILWTTALMAVEVVFLLSALVAFDLFNNKILIGQKLESAQASLLFLDHRYVGDPALMSSSLLDDDDDEVESKPTGEEAAVFDAVTCDAATMLSPAQRRTVRDRLGILFAIVAFILIPVVGYYRTWLLQRVNQHLRVTMIERAEHLSLRYHSQAQTGDAIYRVYQDSAMITSVIEGALLEPVVALAQVLFSFFVIWLFSPLLGFIYLAGIVPALVLVAFFTPRLQRRSRVARATNSTLTSTIQEDFAAIRIIKANRAEAMVRRRFDETSTAALNAAFYLRREYLLLRVLITVLAGLLIFTSQYLMAGWTIASDPTFLAGTVALVGFTLWNLGAFQAASSRSGEFLGNGEHLVG